VSITVTKYSPIECVIKTVGESSLDLFGIDSSNLVVTSAVLPAEMLPTIRAQAAVLRDLVGSADFATVLPGALPRLLTASPLGSLNALTLAVITVGTVSTLRVSGLTDPCWFIAAAAHSITGGFNTDRGTFTSGGGGSGTGTVPAPNGPYPAIPAGTPVALSGGVLVAADAGVLAKMPCIGVYNGSTADTIQTDGSTPTSGVVSLNADQYVAIGGGFTSTAPSGVGVWMQRIGKSVGTADIFVTIGTMVLNP
jgi:hypothetical protein